MSRDALGIFARKRLVVFGAGYVGTEVVRLALAHGGRVTALTRNPVKARDLESLGARVIVANLAEESWHAEIAPAEFVVNCVSSGGGGTAGYQRSYVGGMKSIRQWLSRGQNVDALIYTSSTSVYPQSGGVVDETAPTDGAIGNATILLEAESWAKTFAENFLCRRSVVLRLAGIYGPGRHHILDQLRGNVRPLPGKGDHRLNLVYRDDVVSAIVTAIERAAGPWQMFNVVDDLPAKKADVVAWLAARLGCSVPDFSGDPVPGRRPDPPDRVVSNAKIKRELGWTPQFPDYQAGYEAILGA